MPYLYGISDTKFIADENDGKNKLAYSEPTRFKINPQIKGHGKYDRNAHPIQFRSNPPTLVELCLSVVDKIPLPPIYEWTNMQVLLWIHRYGYPQYKNTFRVNMVSGRKLLLVDASALSAMNIKDFDHITHISYGIRMLFHFEMTKFSSNLSLPDEKPYELYLLWHTQSGRNYDAVRRSDLFERMQMIRKHRLNLNHWQLLELCMQKERKRQDKKVIAFTQRPTLYCKPKVESVKVSSLLATIPAVDDLTCVTCLPPCACLWTDRDTRTPWRLNCLKDIAVNPNKKPFKWTSRTQCDICVPPCECHWLPRAYLTPVITCLQETFPDKFVDMLDNRIGLTVHPHLHEQWIRYSI